MRKLREISYLLIKIVNTIISTSCFVDLNLAFILIEEVNLRQWTEYELFTIQQFATFKCNKNKENCLTFKASLIQSFREILIP